METRDDTALVMQARGGDTAAFGELFRRHHARVFRLCRTYCGTDADAGDLVQEVFLKAFRGLAGLERGAAFSGWLAAIARNQARDRAVQRSRRCEEALEGAAEPLAGEGSSEDRVLRAEARGLAREIVEAMPPGTPRQVAALFYLEDLEVRDVAHRLGMSVSNVTTSLARARTWMRRNLLLRLAELRGYAT